MKVLFESVGVLVHYNWALPYKLISLKNDVQITIISNLFQMILGGKYYLRLSQGALKPLLVSLGLKHTQKFENKLIKIKYLYIKERVNNYNIIHINDINSNIILIRDIPKILTIHGSPEFIDKKDFCKKIYKIEKRVNEIIVASHYSAKMMYEQCGINSRVINHGVDISLFNPIIPRNIARNWLKIPNDRFVILWNARLVPEKGLHTLINALVSLNNRTLKNNKIFLLIKTRSINRNYFNQITGLVNKYRLNEFVKFDTSWTRLELMPLYYRSADLFINTSYTEAFGSLAMLEAMACGIPVIARNASSNPEALGNAGMLFNDHEELAFYIQKIVNDNSLRKLLSIKAINRIINEGLTLDKSAIKYLKIYESII